MRILIVEDDMASRKLLERFLSRFGTCEIAVNGLEALEAFLTAHKEKNSFSLICLDIMMPKLDGLRVLRAIRDYEEQKQLDTSARAKVIMTTALNDQKTVMESYEIGCEGYAWKPLDLDKLKEVLVNLKLIDASQK